VLCDITDQAAIDAVAERLTGDLGDAGLHGLVNNAGIAQPAPIEIIPSSEKSFTRGASRSAWSSPERSAPRSGAGAAKPRTLPSIASRRRSERFTRTWVTAVRKMARRMDEHGLAPEKVAERIGHALTARRPHTRYVVGTDARIQIALASVLPDRAFDAVTRRLLGA
jgi:NAD(P)-dependent dehydrogenase (short-subunit alcohol dehydrogenase family)